MYNQTIETGNMYKGAYKLEIYDPQCDMVIKDYGWKNNLILNSGMNQLYNNNPEECMNYCYIGTGAVSAQPLEYDGDSGVTVSWTGNTVTFSGAGCSNLVQYRVIKFIEAGVTAFITSIASVNSVTVLETASTPITNNTFKIYATERYKLVSQSKLHNTVLVATDDYNQSTKITTYTRQYEFAYETVSQNYTEAGVTWTTGSPANLFSRVIFDSTVNVPINKKLRLTYSLSSTVSPVFYPLSCNWTVDGWPLSAGTFLIEYNAGSIEPYKEIKLSLTSDSTPLQNRTGGFLPSGQTSSTNAVKQGYLTNSFSCIKKATWDTSSSINPIRSIISWDPTVGGASYFRFLFTSVSGVSYPSKDTDHTLTMSYQQDWGRIV